jgi:SAM-dependent methyltransferase
MIMMKYDPELYSSDKRNFLNQELIFYKKLVKKIKPKRILELGVGNGRIFSKLLPHVEYGVGIDISPKMLRECKKECNNFANYKIYKMDFINFVLPCGFDFIYMPFNTFHHILSYRGQLSCIKNVYSIMNKGAIFILDFVIIDIKKLNYNWKLDYKSRLNKKEVIMRYQRTKDFNKKKGIVVKEFIYEI